MSAQVELAAVMPAIPAGCSNRGFTVVRLLLGCVLLAAAFLKNSDATWEPFGQVFTVPPPIQLVFIELEAAIGVWLLLGFAPSLLRQVAIGYFAALAAASAGLLIFGVPSCGCFGNATVSPWWALGLDIAAIAALVLVRPESRGDRHSAVAGWAFAGLILILAVEVIRHGGPTAAWVIVAGTVAIEPGRVDLGEVPAGEPHYATVTVVNRGDRDVRLSAAPGIAG